MHPDKPAQQKKTKRGIHKKGDSANLPMEMVMSVKGLVTLQWMAVLLVMGEPHAWPVQSVQTNGGVAAAGQETVSLMDHALTTDLVSPQSRLEPGGSGGREPTARQIRLGSSAPAKDPESTWQPYKYTPTDRAAMKRTNSEEAVCSMSTDRVFTRGRNKDYYPGCGGGWCCVKSASQPPSFPGVQCTAFSTQ